MKNKLILAAIFYSGMAFAVLPPQAYLSARAEAPRHVQISIASVSPPQANEMACAVRGEVVRRFRGNLKVGRKLALQVDCRRPEGGFAGPQLFIDETALRTARYAEVFLSADASPAVVRWQFHIIDAPSKKPRCGAKEWACR